MRYDVSHRTRTRYARPVRFTRCNLRLRPIEWDGQVVESHAFHVEPRASFGEARDSGYAVNVTRMLIDRPAGEVVIDSRFRVTVNRPVPDVRADDPTVAEVGAAARASRDLGPTGPASYLFASPLIALDPAIADYCAAELDPARGIVEAGFALTRRIFTDFRYDGTATEADTPPAEAFAKRHGVCQDFAQIMIAGLRASGVPAAYVSGYLRTIPPAGKPRLVGADATHAWVLIWCGPARGWIGFDPTNDCAMAGDHIVTAIGRDYADVAPVDGIFLGGGRQKIDVSVDVAPIEG
ncbi:transglutaminase family protein [Sphingomonas solaris]|uniref:Transglutaminase family protein n=1 Tax=Alterirhizorhabdus solaris TaxID=2529389 RepID=A0A558R4Z2_9SPHN|nr:transglutaminase family protein [Sphingomonas solaris]TVV74402.1 transglutaminase family protein [Sphingomonas solaris]